MPSSVMPAGEGQHACTNLASRQPSESGPVLRSQEILQGRSAIVIEHNGAVYRLQTTRQGKLILTK